MIGSNRPSPCHCTCIDPGRAQRGAYVVKAAGFVRLRLEPLNRLPQDIEWHSSKNLRNDDALSVCSHLLAHRLVEAFVRFGLRGKDPAVWYYRASSLPGSAGPFQGIK